MWLWCAVNDRSINSSDTAGEGVSATHRESEQRSSFLLDRGGKAFLETLALDGQVRGGTLKGQEGHSKQT